MSRTLMYCRWRVCLCHPNICGWSETYRELSCYTFRMRISVKYRYRKILRVYTDTLLIWGKYWNPIILDAKSHVATSITMKFHGSLYATLGDYVKQRCNTSIYSDIVNRHNSLDLRHLWSCTHWLAWIEPYKPAMNSSNFIDIESKTDTCWPLREF